MRRVDDVPFDPEIAAVLDAIDATLAGEPVDPAHAEYAELALLLAADRPRPEPHFSSSLDDRLASRFASPGPARAPRRWRASLLPAIGLAAATLIAVVVAVGSGAGTPGSSGPRHEIATSSPSTTPGSPRTTAGSPSTTAGTPSATGGAPSPAGRGAGRARATIAPLVPGNPDSLGLDQRASVAAAPAPYPGLHLPSNGRKVVQSSQLALSAPSSRIDEVAQEVFNVVGSQSGFVNSSTVTASGGPGGYAQFQLSVPSSSLAQTMTALSQLRYAQVLSRTDNTNDVTNQYNGASGQLAQAQALRTSLLRQLQNAVTQTQIASLQAQLADANAKIASAQSTLRSLGHQISYSTISLMVNGATPLPVHSGTPGFTIGKAAHEAVRVLTVAAGIALIALAVLVPLSLLAALGWWVSTALRRRRREQALELA